MGKEGLLDLFKVSRNDSVDQRRNSFDQWMKFRVAVLEERVGMDSVNFYVAFSNGKAPDSGSSIELANIINYRLRKLKGRVA